MGRSGCLPELGFFKSWSRLSVSVVGRAELPSRGSGRSRSNQHIDILAATAAYKTKERLSKTETSLWKPMFYIHVTEKGQAEFRVMLACPGIVHSPDHLLRWYWR